MSIIEKILEKQFNFFKNHGKNFNHPSDCIFLTGEDYRNLLFVGELNENGFTVFELSICGMRILSVSSDVTVVGHFNRKKQLKKN